MNLFVPLVIFLPPHFSFFIPQTIYFLNLCNLSIKSKSRIAFWSFGNPAILAYGEKLIVSGKIDNFNA
jgi:hypothetical protein